MIAVEILAIKIRNSSIKGIELPKLKDLQINIKCRQLADDTSLFLKDENDINSAVIEEFYSFSGLKLNSHKTKLMEIGHHIQDDIDIPFGIADKIKILGLVFENGKRAIDIDENWTGRIEKLTCIIQLWSKRDLSIMGKTVIVKCFLVRQLIYIMQSMGLPEKVKQVTVNNRGSIVLDYNAIINVIPKPWLDWISAKFRSVSRQSVIWIIEVYNDIYRRSSWIFIVP